jgi:hypothetical protein
VEIGNGFDVEVISNFFPLKKYSSERKINSFGRKILKEIGRT